MSIIRITSQREGFRRCGMPHPATTTEYPDSRFAPDEILRFQNEPMLEVEIVEGKKSAEPIDSIESTKSTKPKKQKKTKQGGKIK